MKKDYILDSGSDLGGEQLSYLQRLFDAPTKAFLDDTGVRQGWQCLDLGAGKGSITNWLADRTGPDGRVVAVDLDIDHLVARPGVRARRHDINDGVPPGGPFDLIHARLLLVHLPRREQILTELVDALAPGGWLVLGEFSDRPQQVLSAPSENDEEVVRRVVDTGVRVLADAGASWEWAHEVDSQMAAAGLVNVEGLEYCRTITGGTAGCLLYKNYAKQVESRLLDAGITEDELRRFCALMDDPCFHGWPFFQMVFTRGQKPLV